MTSRLRARRSLRTESTSRRGLFESFDKTQDRLREFPRHLIRYGGGGTRRAAHGRKWFWFLLPKQKGLVCRGETLHIIILDGKPSVVIGEGGVGLHGVFFVFHNILDKKSSLCPCRHGQNGRKTHHFVYRFSHGLGIDSHIF